MEHTIVIGGEVSLLNRLDGDGDVTLTCDGIEGVVIQYDSHSEYTGEYEVTPSSETQVIPIANFIATQNIIVNPVPQNYGLVSWNGSYLTIS